MSESIINNSHKKKFSVDEYLFQLTEEGIHGNDEIDTLSMSEEEAKKLSRDLLIVFRMRGAPSTSARGFIRTFFNKAIKIIDNGN